MFIAAIAAIMSVAPVAQAGFGSIDVGGGPTWWWEAYPRDTNGMLVGLDPGMLNGRSAHAREFCLELVRGRYVYAEIVTLNSKAVAGVATCANSRKIAARPPKGWKCSRSRGGPMRGGRMSCGNGDGTGSTHVHLFGIRRGSESQYIDIAYPRYAFTGCGVYVLGNSIATHYSRSTCSPVADPWSCNTTVDNIMVCDSDNILIPGDPGASPAVALGASYYLPKSLQPRIGAAATH